MSDKATNAATPVIRMVTVTDTAAPDISPPADITFEATDTLTLLDRSDYGIATSGDDTADITDDAPDAFPLGDTTITWTATDKSTNEMMDTQVVTVVDTTKPSITAPGNITKEATGYTTLVTPGQATATDFVADMVAITRDLVGDEADLVVGSASVGDIQMGNEFTVGTHKIIWTADDGNGNIITAEQTITITDTTKPVIVLLGADPQTVEFGSIYNDPGATATDAVDDNDELTIQIAAASTVDTGTVGDYTVTYTVSDKATNAATPVIRMVTVTDTEAPDIIAPADITFEATATLTPLDRSDYGIATSTDGNADITDDAPAAFPLGETMIEWTATDTNNLRSAAEQMVTITDTTKPVITLLGANPMTIEVDENYVEFGATAVDRMDGDLTAKIMIDSTDVDTNTVGTYTVTYTVADLQSNRAQASRSVRVSSGSDFADLNRIILSEVARAMADQNVQAVARRIEQTSRKAVRTATLGGQSSLEGIIKTQGRALSTDQFNLKRLLADTDFVLPLGASEGDSEGTSEETSILTIWGAGDYRNINDADQVTWDGDFFSLHLGLDTHLSASLVAGVALSWNQVDLDYSNYTSAQFRDRADHTATSGDYALEMTSIHPYVGWNLGRLDLWATLGYGEGELEITDDGNPMARNLSSNLNLRTVALGVSGLVLEAGAINLRVKTEALRSELEVVGNEHLAALSLDVSRFRMTLEATGIWSLNSGAQVGLTSELGLRYDGGAGKIGRGTELGGGLRYVSAAKNLTLEAKARGVSRYKGGMEEFGVSGLIKFEGSSDGQGLSFSLTPAYGEAASSDLQRFWQQGLMNQEDGDTGLPDYAPRLDLRLNYGLLVPGGHGLLTPYSEMTFGDRSDTYRLGLMWKFHSLLNMKLVGERREMLDAEHGIRLEGTLSF